MMSMKDFKNLKTLVLQGIQSGGGALSLASRALQTCGVIKFWLESKLYRHSVLDTESQRLSNGNNLAIANHAMLVRNDGNGVFPLPLREDKSGFPPLGEGARRAGEGQLFAQQTETNSSHKRSFASLKMTNVGHSEQREESHKLDCFARSADGGNGARNDGKFTPLAKGGLRGDCHTNNSTTAMRALYKGGNVRNDETPLVPQYLSALVPFKKAAFTLAEMMVVMLIASIILACMAPAITTRIKMDQTSNQNLSPWKWTADDTGDAYFSHEDNATAMIGQNEKGNISAKLIINNSTGLDDLIFFKNNDNINGHLRIDENELYLGTPVYGGSSVSVGTDIVPWGAPNLDAVSIGHNIKPARRSVFIGSGIKNTGGSTTSDSGMNSVAIGVEALGHVSDGYDNIAIGSDSLSQTTTGWGNTAVGVGALMYNTTGGANIAIGLNALRNNTNTAGNIAIGEGAMQDSSTDASNGMDNIAIGGSALLKNEGVDNVAVGHGALEKNTQGSSNTAVGFATLSLNTTGSNNVAIGSGALQNQKSTTVSGTDVVPSGNVAIGSEALAGNRASDNVAIGRAALNSNGYGEGNVAVGAEALKALSGNNADYNTAIGSGALAGVSIHDNNVAVGYHALNQERSGGNTAVGSFALAGGTYDSDSYTVTPITSGRKNGMSNTAVGYLAMVSNNGGQDNVAVGYKALLNNSSGNYNVAIGNEALNNNTKGGQNTAIGYQALYENSEGNYNIAVGEYACKYVKGSNKTCIGKGSGPASGDTLAAADNEERVIFLGDANTTVYIPGKLRVDGNVELAVNSSSRIKVRAYGNNNKNVFNTMFRDTEDLRTNSTTSVDPELPSDRRLKNVGKENLDGLAKLRKIKVFNYTFKDDKEKTPRVGVIAQDLQKIFPNAVKKGADGFLRIRMEDMFYAVINAIKELDSRITKLEKENQELRARLEKLEAKIK